MVSLWLFFLIRTTFPTATPQEPFVVAGFMRCVLRNVCAARAIISNQPPPTSQGRPLCWPTTCAGANDIVVALLIQRLASRCPRHRTAHPGLICGCPYIWYPAKVSSLISVPHSCTPHISGNWCGIDPTIEIRTRQCCRLCI